MAGPPAPVAAVRHAVRVALARPGDLPQGHVVVACSGGADSLALAAAAAGGAPRAGRTAGAAVVDHGLQPGSDRVAAAAADQCRALGLAPVDVLTVDVTAGPGGPEAAARTARHAALAALSARHGGAPVLLGHTRDDQAEQVLLGLVRGSGARSLSGMPRVRLPFVRPLLHLGREVTRAACAGEGLVWWEDPHNADPAYLRVRARELLPLLEQRLGPGVVAGLARSADLLRDDADLLDDLARRARAGLDPGGLDPGGLDPGGLDARALAELPRALRTRVWRLVAVAAGAPAGGLFSVHVAALDALVSDWKGQGPVDLPGGIQASRLGDRVSFATRGRLE